MSRLAPRALLTASVCLFGASAVALATAPASSAPVAPTQDAVRAPLGSVNLLTPADRTPDLDAPLVAAMDAAAPGETVSALVHLLDRADLETLDAFLTAEGARRATRHFEVITALRDAAERSQPEVLAQIDAIAAEAAAADGRSRVDRVDAFWIANVIRIDATPDVIARVAALPGVDRAFFNNPIDLTAPVEADPEITPPAGPTEGSAPEPGVAAVNAPEAWALGFDGAGAVVGVMDTGVDGNHPSLADRWRGLDPQYASNPEWAWFDPYTNQNDFPFDGGSSGHGTHVAGSVLGGAPGDTIGVAPGAQWIAAGSIDRGGGIPQTVADAIESFEWFADPDGDPSTVFDAPDIVTNSWGLLASFGYPLCDDLFWSFTDALEFAGTIVIFAAGNEGFSEIRRPADRATDPMRTFSVGAVDGNSGSFPVASFSARGPSFCTFDGGPAIKPEIAAPGVSVRSAAAGSSGYSFKSGTSMATPHVAGVMAIIRGVNPDLTVQQVKQIVFDSAVDLGQPGEDNNYGHGMIDALAAVEAALQTVGVTFGYPEGRPDLVAPAGGATVRVSVESQQAAVLPGSGRLHWRVDGGPWQDVAMAELEPGLYEGTFPALPCGASVDWYASAQAENEETFTSPFSAPDDVWKATAFASIDVLFEDDFEGFLGWTVEDVGGLTDGSWQRAVPAGGGDRGDPPTDADGSGRAYVTDNADGNSDVDGGGTRLISPIMDASTAPLLTYARWFHNSFGAAPASDVFLVEISDDGGATWMLLEQVGPDGPEVNGGWFQPEFDLGAIDGFEPNDQFRIRFTAQDLGDGSVVEAGVDAVRLEQPVCGDEPSVLGDLDGDGVVAISDLLVLLAEWGPCDACAADLDESGTVDFSDLVILLGEWTP